MRRCASLLRHGPHYRAEVFAEGLRRHGFQVERKWERKPRPEDALIVWNRTRGYESVVEIYQRAGARVIVAENGYIDRAPDGRKYYALALDSHNGAGRWFVGDRPRFEIEEQPWRQDGRKVLVLPQRGIGQPGVAMPAPWPKAIVPRLREITSREIVFRPHPGHQKHSPAICFDDIWCAVTWGSGAAIKALRAGVPVFHDFPQWIGAVAAARLVDDLERCQTPSRRLLWTRVSWAQWTLDEIASGEALDRLVNENDRGLFRAGQSPFAAGREGDGQGDCEDGRLAVAQVLAHPYQPPAI